MGTPPAAGPATPPPTSTQWFWAPNVPGPGDKPPEWFKAAKYTSVEEQAKAYNELEKRFGNFTGAPKDGAYSFTVDKTIAPGIEADTSHPVFKQFETMAKDMQLSQDGFTKIMNTFMAYEASMIPSPEVFAKQVGDNAPARINSVAQWAKANLDDAGYTQLRNVVAGSNAAETFKLLESIIGKTRQVALPKVDASVAASFVDQLAEINRLQAAKDPKTGQRYYENDSVYRANVERLRMEHFKNKAAAQ